MVEEPFFTPDYEKLYPENTIFDLVQTLVENKVSNLVFKDLL